MHDIRIILGIVYDVYCLSPVLFLILESIVKIPFILFFIYNITYSATCIALVGFCAVVVPVTVEGGKLDGAALLEGCCISFLL